MDLPTDHQILTTMRKYGGGFEAQLALAAFCADDENLSKIKLAFPELWEKHAKLWKADQRRKEKDTPHATD